MKTDKLKQFHPCSDAVAWVRRQPDAVTAWHKCQRGDWMLWIAKRLNVDDRKLTLAKYHCANQVRHLMRDERSIKALDAAYKYGIGEIDRQELNDAAVAAYAAYVAADAATDAAYAAYAAYVAAYAAYAVAAGAAVAAYAAYAVAAVAAYAAYAVAAGAAVAAYAAYVAADAAYAAYAAYAAADAAKKDSLKRSADICRDILTEEVMNAFNKL